MVRYRPSAMRTQDLYAKSLCILDFGFLSAVGTIHVVELNLFDSHMMLEGWVFECCRHDP